MPRHTGYHRIYAKRPTHPDEENLFKRKKQSANSSSSPVAEISPIAQTTVQRAKTSPQNLTAQEVRQLQATIGNRALARMMTPQITKAAPPVSAAPVLQRTPITVKQSAPHMNVVQRWKWPWRRNETVPQKIARYEKTMDNLKTAVTVLRLGHGVVMLPLTVVDLLSNIARPFTGNQAKVDSGGSKKEQDRKVFNNVINGETMLVAFMGGAPVTRFDLSFLKYMPWNIIPWIIAGLNRWYDKVDKKRKALL